MWWSECSGGGQSEIFRERVERRGRIKTVEREMNGKLRFF